MADKKQVSVRLTESEMKQIDVIAEENGRNRNQEIALLVRNRIKQQLEERPDLKLDQIAMFK
jgi:hypothetical protein